MSLNDHALRRAERRLGELEAQAGICAPSAQIRREILLLRGEISAMRTEAQPLHSTRSLR